MNKKLQEKRNYLNDMNFRDFKRIFWEKNGIQGIGFNSGYQVTRLHRGSTPNELEYHMKFHLFAYDYSYLNKRWENKKTPRLVLNGHYSFRGEEIDAFSDFLNNPVPGSYNFHSYGFYYTKNLELGFRYFGSRKKDEEYKSYPARDRKRYAVNERKRKKFENFLLDPESARQLKEYVKAVAQLQAWNVEDD